jgi:glycosyltransferase involved in cell wall biosynthesis
MEVYEPGQKKEQLILSVARMEEGGTKKQKEMASAFIDLKKRFPAIASGWKLIIAGGSTGVNTYIPQLKKIIERENDNSIELKINISGNELKSLYKRASIFWHLCGLGENDPARVEHFGMTIGEAMQNRLAPIVFDGGGQKEIVEHGISGYRISSLNGLIVYTKKIMENKDLRNTMGEKAYSGSLRFNKKRFSEEVKSFFDDIIPGI